MRNLYQKIVEVINPNYKEQDVYIKFTKFQVVLDYLNTSAPDDRKQIRNAYNQQFASSVGFKHQNLQPKKF